MLVGPAGALITMALIIAAVWRFTTVKLWPFLANYLEKQQDNFQKLLDTQDADRKLYQESMNQLWISHSGLERDVDDIKTDLKELKHIVKEKS